MKRLARCPRRRVPAKHRLLVLGALLLASCGSNQTSVTKIIPTQGTVTIETPTSAAGGPGTSSETVPTVFNCGGGAFEPKTLLVTCANAAKDAATIVTGVSWTSWSSTTAAGMGTVHLYVAGKSVSAAASLTLSDVTQTSNGLQFSKLSLAWSGPSPDGQPTLALPLAVAPQP